MIRRPPRSTQSRSSAASDVYKRQALDGILLPVQSLFFVAPWKPPPFLSIAKSLQKAAPARPFPMIGSLVELEAARFLPRAWLVLPGLELADVLPAVPFPVPFLFCGPLPADSLHSIP